MEESKDITIDEFIENYANKFPGIVSHVVYPTPFGGRHHYITAEPGDMTRYRILLSPLPTKEMGNQLRDKYLIGVSPITSGMKVEEISFNMEDVMADNMKKSRLFNMLQHSFGQNFHTTAIIFLFIRHLIILDKDQGYYI